MCTKLEVDGVEGGGGDHTNSGQLEISIHTVQQSYPDKKNFDDKKIMGPQTRTHNLVTTP